MLNPGTRIYEYRIRKGWTQAELARRAGLAQANLSNIEKGKRDFTVSMLLRLAQALEIKPSYLIEEEKAPKPFSLTRSHIETLAHVVIDPKTKSSSQIRKLAVLLRIILPETEKKSNQNSQKIQQAWALLKQHFSSEEIRGIFQRVEDARQRIYAQKEN